MLNRRIERVQLPSPVDATAGSIPVVLVDASRTGFKVHHRDTLPPKGERFLLRFHSNGAEIRVQCVTAWTTIHRFATTTAARPTFASGLQIQDADAASMEQLEAMIERLQSEGVRNETPYLHCELIDSKWTRRRTAMREQPTEGFTVSASEDAAQVERLCSAYASGDGETRKLIRTLAALSLHS